MACVGSIAKAMGPPMELHVRSLLDAMFSAGLSATLVEALEQITARQARIYRNISIRYYSGIYSIEDFDLR